MESSRSSSALAETVTVNVTADGYIELGSATQAMGQGIATSYAQLAVDVFGVDIDRIRVLQGDTDRANGFGSAGSRSLFTGGSAMRVGADRALDKARALAATELEVAAEDLGYANGEFTVAGTDLRIGLFALADIAESDHHLLQAAVTMELRLGSHQQPDPAL